MKFINVIIINEDKFLKYLNILLQGKYFFDNVNFINFINVTYLCFENNKYIDGVNILWKRRILDFFWKDILVKI